MVNQLLPCKWPPTSPLKWRFSYIHPCAWSWKKNTPRKVTAGRIGGWTWVPHLWRVDGNLNIAATWVYAIHGFWGVGSSKQTGSWTVLEIFGFVLLPTYAQHCKLVKDFLWGVFRANLWCWRLKIKQIQTLVNPFHHGAVFGATNGPLVLLWIFSFWEKDPRQFLTAWVCLF